MQKVITIVNSPVKDDEYIVISPIMSALVVQRVGKNWKAKSALVKSANGRRFHHPLPSKFKIPQEIIEALDQFIAETT